MPSCIIDLSAHSHIILLIICDNACLLISNKHNKVLVETTILFLLHACIWAHAESKMSGSVEPKLRM